MTENWSIEYAEGEVFLAMNGRRIAKILPEQPEADMIASVILKAVILLTEKADAR